jgi:Ca-activated chloride channel family protein
MKFAHPYLLLLLLLIPALLWWRARRRGPAVNFPDGALLKKLPVSPAVRLQPVLTTLYVLGLTCLIVAIARPQRGLQESRVNTEGVDIVLLLDISPSMREPISLQQSKLDAAKQVIENFVNKRKDDRIGMVGFAALPYSIAPLTLDHGWLIGRIRPLQAGALGDGTAIGDAIASAANRLRESKAKSRIIVLLTDGENNCGELSPENAAQASAALNIKIYTIGFTLNPNIGVDALKRIAELSKAEFFRARDLKTLEEVYARIDKLEKTEIEMLQYTRFEEKSGSWLLAALFFLSLEKILTLSRFGRLPE